MSHSIKSLKKDKCVSLTLEGEIPLIEIMAARYVVSGLLAKWRWNKAVVKIADLHSTLTTLEVIDFASDLSSDLPRDARVALVVRLEQERNAKIIERVARGGGVLLAYFFDMEEAKAWLTGTTQDGQIHDRPDGRRL